jgi:hypothetical protein
MQRARIADRDPGSSSVGCSSVGASEEDWYLAVDPPPESMKGEDSFSTSAFLVREVM